MADEAVPSGGRRSGAAQIETPGEALALAVGASPLPPYP
jgi:hypothetical protein